MSDKKNRWGLQYACIIFAMSLPVLGFTAAAVFMFLDHQVWPGSIFTLLAFLTMPNVKVKQPSFLQKEDPDDDI